MIFWVKCVKNVNESADFWNLFPVAPILYISFPKLVEVCIVIWIRKSNWVESETYFKNSCFGGKTEFFKQKSWISGIHSQVFLNTTIRDILNQKFTFNLILNRILKVMHDIICVKPYWAVLAPRLSTDILRPTSGVIGKDCHYWIYSWGQQGLPCTPHPLDFFS